MSTFSLEVGKTRKVKRLGITKRLKTVKGVTLQTLELSAIKPIMQMSETAVCRLIRVRRLQVVLRRQLMAYMSCCLNEVLKPYCTFRILDWAMARERTLLKREMYKLENFISESAATRASLTSVERSTTQVNNQVTLR